MSGYRVTPDNGYVVFQGDLDTAGVLDLYSAPLAPASAPIPARLNGAPGSGGTLQRFTFTRGMSLDLSSGGATLSTLDTGTALSGLGSFDVLFFDACLMGMIESAYEVRNAADYFVAGQKLNATVRTCPPALTRRSRTPARQAPHLEAAMFWMGVVYNFCRIHTTLQGTPAMAADLTDHVWSVHELLYYRVARE